MAPPLEVEEPLVCLQRDPRASSNILSASDSSPDDPRASRRGGELMTMLEKREKELADSIL